MVRIPFGKYQNIQKFNSKTDINLFLLKSMEKLNDSIYGHNDSKLEILQIISQWISNPNSLGKIIGIQGPMGNGKTTLVKNGITKIIDRPFFFISLGGSCDSSYLNGHSYTYEGATYGKIVDILIRAKIMNPIIYFDELDKVSKTKKGDEIINLLIHLTDPVQNCKFQDKYYSGIDIDISKCFFIFSFNNIKDINPILLDRLKIVKTKGYNLNNKINIANKFIIPNIINELNINKNKIKINNNCIKFIIKNYTNEKGVRNLKKLLYDLYSKLNIILLTNNLSVLKNKIKTLPKIPIQININMIKSFLGDCIDKSYNLIYI